MASSMPDKPNDDEDLESVAESLLGIDFSGAAEIPDSIELDDDDLFADEEETPAVESSASVAEPAFREPQASPATWSEDGEDDAADFGFGLDIEDELEDISFAAEPVRPSSREERPVEPDLEPEPVAESENPAAPHGTPSKDEFWDALEGWDWGEEEKEPKSSSGGRRRTERESPPERTREPERTSRPAARREESVDDDFGADLAGDRSAPPPFHEREPESERPREERPRRDEGRDSRRRGGRRGSRSESDDRRGGRERPRHEDRPVREERPAPRPRVEPEPAASDDDDAGGFGEGLDLEAQPTERAGREREESQSEERRGRRRGRGRGRDRDRESRSAEPAAERPARVEEPDFGGDEPFGAEEPSAASESDVQESRFQDVPTWQEAISYLVRPRAKSGSTSGSGAQSESGGSEGSRRSSEEERPRRRGGRRGGSRRPRD